MVMVRGGVSEAFADDLDRHGSGDEQCAVGVTEVVVVPTPAQTRLCRPPRYADLDGEALEEGANVLALSA
jgi:hypothetical protein